MGRISKNCALALLRAYKYAISPLLLPSCRYTPTCSDYAAEAIELHGVIRGLGLSMWRLLRCHPFVRGGFDPVPRTFGGPLSHRTADQSIRQESFQVGSPGEGGCPGAS